MCLLKYKKRRNVSATDILCTYGTRCPFLAGYRWMSTAASNIKSENRLDPADVSLGAVLFYGLSLYIDCIGQSPLVMPYLYFG